MNDQETAAGYEHEGTVCLPHSSRNKLTRLYTVLVKFMQACGDDSQAIAVSLTFSTESMSSVALLYLCIKVQALLLTSQSTMVLLRSSSNSAKPSSWGEADAGPGIGHLKLPPPADNSLLIHAPRHMGKDRSLLHGSLHCQRRNCLQLAVSLTNAIMKSPCSRMAAIRLQANATAG